MRSSCWSRRSSLRRRPTWASTGSRPQLFARYPDARSAGVRRSRRRREADRGDRVLPAEDAGLAGHLERAASIATRARCRGPWRPWSSFPGSGGRRPMSCSATRSVCRGCPWIVTSCESATGLGIAHSDDPERVEQQLSGAFPPSQWTRVIRHPDPARATHLQADSALRQVHGQFPVRLQMAGHCRPKPAGRRSPSQGQPRAKRHAQGHAQATSKSARKPRRR